MRADFLIQTKDKTVSAIGKSTVYTPKVRWNGKGVKWYDDSKLLKNSKKNK